MFSTNATQAIVTSEAGQVCRALRDDLSRAQNFGKWLGEQTDTELTSLGFSSGDVTVLRGAFSDLSTIVNVLYGSATVATAKDYSKNMRQVIGPQ